MSSSKPRPCGGVSVSLTTSRLQISRANENRWPFRLKGFVCSSRIAIKSLSSVWPRSPLRGPESVERSVQSLSCGRGKDPHQHHSPCLAKRLAEVPRWRLLRGRRRPRRVAVFTEPAGRASFPLFLRGRCTTMELVAAAFEVGRARSNIVDLNERAKPSISHVSTRPLQSARDSAEGRETSRR